MSEIVTSDLGKFGAREWHMLRDILNAMIDDVLPSDFENEGVHPMMNMSSGHVFLTNEEFQVAMMNGDKLESFYSCPECGHEGFKAEMAHGDENTDCEEYCKDIGVWL